MLAEDSKIAQRRKSLFPGLICLLSTGETKYLCSMGRRMVEDLNDDHAVVKLPERFSCSV